MIAPLTLARRMPRIRYIRGNCAGRMPRIRYKQSHCTRTYATYVCYMQNARHFTALFSNIFAFRKVLRVPHPISFYRSTFN